MYIPPHSLFQIVSMLLLHSCAHCQPSGTRHVFSAQVHSQLKKLLSSVAWFRCSAVNRVNSGTFCTWFIRCFVQRRRGSLRASGFPYCGTAVETVLHSVIQLAMLLLLLSEGRNGQQDCLLLKCLRCQAVTFISAVIDRKLEMMKSIQHWMIGVIGLLGCL